MANIYEEKQKMFIDLDRQIKEDVFDNKGKLNLIILCFNLTKSYAVSEKAILERLNKWVLMYPNILILDDKCLKHVEFEGDEE